MKFIPHGVFCSLDMYRKDLERIASNESGMTSDEIVKHLLYYITTDEEYAELPEQRVLPTHISAWKGMTGDIKTRIDTLKQIQKIGQVIKIGVDELFSFTAGVHGYTKENLKEDLTKRLSYLKMYDNESENG